MKQVYRYFEDGELSSLPDWDDVDAVYTRMQAKRLLRLRSGPTAIAGKIMCIAVFARAARFQDPYFDAEDFLEEYCECRNLDYYKLIDEMQQFYDSLGCWETSAIINLEELSAL